MAQDGNLRILNAKTFKTIDGFKTNIKQERTWGNHLCFSYSGEYAAAIVPHTNKAVVYDVKQRKLLYTTSRHKGDVESVRIDDENHYLVTGGTDGKTYVWNLLSGRMTYAFAPRADYITELEINHIWIASASYDKTISVLNLSTMKTPLLLRGHQDVIVKMKLLTKMRLLCADKSGQVILWDLQSAKIIHRFIKLNDEITSFAVSQDEKFLFVATKMGKVSLFELETNSVLKKDYLSISDKITALCLLENRLVIGTKMGKVNFYDLFLSEEALEKLLNAQEYKALYEAFEDNPLLQYSKIFKTLEKRFEELMYKASLALEQEQKTNAKTILEPFADVKTKKAEIQALFTNYAEFKKFSLDVQEGRYALAYAAASRYETFRQSKAYEEMEKRWHLNFNKAKALIRQKDGEAKVRKLLVNFKGISSKSSLIQELFKEKTAYSLFKKKLAQKDFLAISALIEKHPFVKEFDEYDSFIRYIDSLYIKAQKALQKSDYAQAKTYANALLPFKELKEDAQEIINEAEILKVFAQASKEENISLMYDLIGKHPFLMEKQEAKSLEKDWTQHLELAQKYASKADAYSAAQALENFFSIESKHTSISLVMQEAYISQLQRALGSRTSLNTIEKAIERYVALFGINDHIEHYCEEFKAKMPSLLSLSRLKKLKNSDFEPGMIIEDILHS